MKHFTFLTVSVALIALAGSRPAWSQPNPCAGLSGAAFGLCNAYCRALDCPAGHNGKSCASLRKNWQKQTGQTLFPCDAVCCQCDNGARACSTVKRCRQATQCAIVDRCVDGQCPSACPCGSDCIVDGDDGVCSPVAGANDCRCVPRQPPPSPTPTPTPQCPCGAVCTDTAGIVGRCEPTDPTQPEVCRCVAPPPTPTPTPACPCEANCVAVNGEAGSCKPVAGANQCECVPNTPVPGCGPDPLTGQCGGACPIAGDVCTACTPPGCTSPCVCGTIVGITGAAAPPRPHGRN